MYYQLSKKSRYAMLALSELVLQGTDRQMNARSLAERHHLPVRFLEIILNELKQGGFVQSIRGKAGGYVLARPAAEIRLSEVITFLDAGPARSSEQADAAISDQFVLDSLVLEANRSIEDVFGQCTLEQLVRRELEHRSSRVPNYVI